MLPITIVSANFTFINKKNVIKLLKKEMFIIVKKKFWKVFLSIPFNALIYFIIIRKYINLIILFLAIINKILEYLTFIAPKSLLKELLDLFNYFI